MCVYFKEYIDKTSKFMCIKLTIFKEITHFCCCWSVRTHVSPKGDFCMFKVDC